MTVSYEIKGGDEAQRHLRELSLKLGAGAGLRVGFISGATYPAAQGGHSVAQVAFWNNFGTTRAPPRPFFTQMIEEQAPTWPHKLATALKLTGYRPKAALELVAADINGHLIASITKLTDPPLAASTIERKGFDKPLIDTSVMLRSTGYEVTAGVKHD